MKFSDLALYFQKLEQTSSRLSMTEILSDLFKHAGADEIGNICYLLLGRVAPLYEPIEFGVADKFMIRAIAQSFGVDEKDVSRSFKKLGDLGTAAEEIHGTRDKGQGIRKLSVTDVFQKLEEITKEGGEGSQEKKITLLSELLSSVDALSARFVARIPLGKLRLGFSDKTIIDALSWMIGGNKQYRGRIEQAYEVRPDIGFIATRVKKEGIKGLAQVKAVVGAPILAALCQRLPDAGEMIKKMGEIDVEPKYDGVRTQIHFVKGTRDKGQGARINAYSRNLENTTAMYPEMGHITGQIDADEVILDSEAVGYDEKTDRLIPFQETVTRKRKHDIEFTRKSVPLRFFVFDILYRDGKDLMNTPLSERRSILEKTITKGNVLFVSPHIVTHDVAVLRKYHDEQIRRGLEGVVVKKWDSAYVPGRRGFNWVKFKEEGKTGKLTDTIDGVVMGYYRGEGKRTGFGIGAFLVGVLKGEQFVTITKVGTGVSDELWRKLAQTFQKQQSREKPKQYTNVDNSLIPDYWINPSMVVEIAADDITVSPIHGAGYALRFPRLVKIRDDKRPEQATTVEEIHTMYGNQKSIKK